jgi:hypothetical protein
MFNAQRLSGWLILSGILIAVVWRVAGAPALLGDIDPETIPHRERAVLSIGNVAVALLFAGAQWSLSRLFAGGRTGRLARASAISGTLAAVLATVGTLHLIWSHAGVYELNGYVVLMGMAWALVGYATFAEFRGRVGAAALATGVVYLVACLAVFAGAFIIFVMTMAAAPFGIALVTAKPLRSCRSRTNDAISIPVVEPAVRSV